MDEATRDHAPATCGQGHPLRAAIDTGIEEDDGVFTYIKVCPVCGEGVEFTRRRVLATEQGILRMDGSRIEGSHE